MLKTEVLKYFGNSDSRAGAVRLSKILKISQTAVSKWPDVIPYGWARKIHDVVRDRIPGVIIIVKGADKPTFKVSDYPWWDDK